MKRRLASRHILGLLFVSKSLLSFTDARADNNHILLEMSIFKRLRSEIFARESSTKISKVSYVHTNVLYPRKALPSGAE